MCALGWTPICPSSSEIWGPLTEGLDWDFYSSYLINWSLNCFLGRILAYLKFRLSSYSSGDLRSPRLRGAPPARDCLILFVIFEVGYFIFDQIVAAFQHLYEIFFEFSQHTFKPFGTDLVDDPVAADTLYGVAVVGSVEEAILPSDATCGEQEDDLWLLNALDIKVSKGVLYFIWWVGNLLAWLWSGCQRAALGI